MSYTPNETGTVNFTVYDYTIPKGLHVDWGNVQHVAPDPVTFTQRNISGKVTINNYTPVENAKITLINSVTDEINSIGLTDANGEYIINNLDVFTYEFDMSNNSQYMSTELVNGSVQLDTHGKFYGEGSYQTEEVIPAEVQNAEYATIFINATIPDDTYIISYINNEHVEPGQATPLIREGDDLTSLPITITHVLITNDTKLTPVIHSTTLKIMHTGKYHAICSYESGDSKHNMIAQPHIKAGVDV